MHGLLLGELAGRRGVGMLSFLSQLIEMRLWTGRA